MIETDFFLKKKLLQEMDKDDAQYKIYLNEFR